jgi:integrase
VHKKPLRLKFRSSLAPLLEKFVQEKLACGYRYLVEIILLHAFDRWICGEGLSSPELPKPVLSKWLAKRPTESGRTHQARICLLRQFSRFLVRQGHPAYVPEERQGHRSLRTWVPYVFRQEELRKLFAAADRLRPNAKSPLRYLIMPLIFRVLYGCGMRLSEILNLTVEQVDLQGGVLTVRQGKFQKDRLVPLHPALIERLRAYVKAIGNREGASPFFPAPDGGPYSRDTVYWVFRRLLWECGIPHGGRGRGPRIHDIRHSFACHRLARWYREGADLNAKLPILAAYLGHQDLSGTQRYLHLTAELYPDIASRMEEAFGHIIPKLRALS